MSTTKWWVTSSLDNSGKEAVYLCFKMKAMKDLSVKRNPLFHMDCFIANHKGNKCFNNPKSFILLYNKCLT